ncbi:hypothetical protein P168DRAFT_321633 [Aspergillus campestris IBT 28561]|uniref:Uncharacterized protein n=1 Tax=Aspergillus campestris (strain IBT 28561) TaxID=1392248 RepID=A0A2I1CUD2_ASPC2|nr:uncharacterized protein P168DRAFT_321633 [Aspergillus campestris IBT 28561]PKY01219.1 hypothetical protein P168DRAFT_321633 [Aspergillus campestris IBT 28561]
MEPSTDRVSVVVPPPRIDLTLFESFDEEVERTVDEILSDPSVESNFDDYSHEGSAGGMVDGTHDDGLAAAAPEERPMKRSKKRTQHRSPYFATEVKGIKKGPVAQRNITRMSSAEAEEVEEEEEEADQEEEVQPQRRRTKDKHQPERSSSCDIIEVRKIPAQKPNLQTQTPAGADEDDYVLETLEESQRDRLVSFITSHSFVTNPKYRAKRKKWRRFVSDLRKEAGLANVDKPTIRRLENYVKGLCRDMQKTAMTEREASTDGDGGREKSLKRSKEKRHREDDHPREKAKKDGSPRKKAKKDDDCRKKDKKDDSPRKKAKKDDSPKKKAKESKKSSSSTPATAAEKQNKPEPEIINVDSDDEPVVVSASSSSRSPDINVGYRPIVRRAVSRQPTSESAHGDVDEEPEEPSKHANPVMNDTPPEVAAPTAFQIYETSNEGNTTSPTHASTRSSDRSTSLASHSRRKEEERELRRTRRRNKRQKSTKSKKYRDSLTSQRSENEGRQSPAVSPEPQPLLRTPEKQLNRTALRPDPDTPVMEDPYWDMDF